MGDMLIRKHVARVILSSAQQSEAGGEHAAQVTLSCVQQSATGGEHVLSLTRLEER